MRRLQLFVLIIFCVLLASLAAPAQKRKYSAEKTPKIVVEPIDTDALKTLLTQQRQQPLLVNFWATFCDPCRDEFPDLVKIDKDFRPQSLEFVTVSLDDVSDIKTSVPEFLGSMKATMPAYLLDASDPEPAINLVDPKWRGDLPATFLYNEKGEIVYKHIGRVDTAELRAEIQKLVKKGDGQ
ncbi:MAG TPA: TlpA disulfide reductase family protein [Pyrinomonadaceae bacterium]|nr:TlpA disulfide reductase family protein [Pyrinomonadaceae bacterium]